MQAAPIGSQTQVMDRLFRDHSRWLSGWLERRRWTVYPAEDIVSDVFLALLTMPNVAAVREPRAMITTIARRLIYDARRRSDLERAYQADLAAMPELLDASPEERLVMAQALQAIEAMLRDLSPRARAAFLMSQLEGMKYADIAAELGVSVSMVRKYVAEGLRGALAACAGPL